MQVKLVEFKNIFVPENRQRKEFDPQYTVELAGSIERNGLINLPVLRIGSTGPTLVAGECRLKAIEWLWSMSGVLRYGGVEIEEGYIPYQELTDLDPVDAYEIELEENIRRKDLTWQEQSSATAQLFELRKLQAEKRGTPQPTVASIADEIRGPSGGAHDKTRKELIISRHLDNPEIAKAKTVDEAFKVLKRQEQLQKSAELGRSVGLTFNSGCHQLFKGNCLEWLKSCPTGLYDVILTDPPYGIDAQDYNDSGGKTHGGHFYDDSLENFCHLMETFASESFIITKPQAHLYLFCDIQNFLYLKGIFTCVGWKVFRTPFIAVNPTAMRAPWPDKGPQRKWQMILYAIKGDKHVNQLRPDVLSYPSDDNLNHHAQKPVALYQDLLSRSCNPGDCVIDPFCGTGTIFPAAHELKVRATGIELDESAYGIAVKRLEGLK